jgi:methylmalonyl-CoA/ethylmalonyl-CoA epimerase
MQENHIRMAFFRFDKVLVELLEPTASGCGRIGKFIQSYGEGIEHIAFRVSNLDKEIERFNREKIEMIDKNPRSGANGSRIAYINPAFTQNVFTELVEKNSDQD